MLEALNQLASEYHMFPPGTHVLCAVSGGADSICLLHRLYHMRVQLGIQVTAAHYNHQLRGAESDRDEQFVREFTALCCGSERTAQGVLSQVELLVGRGDVAGEARRRGKGLEETAREMRYAFLRQAAQKAGAQVIATAHTCGDNAETLLLHLVRGSGLRGLTGIAPVNGILIRPLLTTSRQEIEQYLSYYGLPYMRDSSNESDQYTRNRLRHRVVPELEDICPGFLQRVAQTAARLREDEDCLSALAQELVSQAQRQGAGFSIPARTIADAPEAVAVRAVRILIGRMNRGNDNCTAAHLHAVTALCRSENPSAQASLHGGLTARREYQQLLLTRERLSRSLQPQSMVMPGVTQAGEYRLECREVTYQGERQGLSCFYLSKLRTGAVILRARRTGDSLKRPGRGGRALKKLLIDEKIPKSRRDTIPVLEAGGKVAGVTGLGPDVSFLPRLGEQAWQIIITYEKECNTSKNGMDFFETREVE